MKKDAFLIAKWVAGYLSGNGEPEEEFEKWRKEDGNEELLQKIAQEGHIRLVNRRYEDFSKEKGWRELQQRRKKSHERRLFRIWASCAAVAAVLLGFALLWQLGGEKKTVDQEVLSTVISANSKVRLILDSGKEVDLSEQQGTIDCPAGEISNSGGELVYSGDSTLLAACPAHHELVVPPCGEYRLQLCDGTVVHLNAATRLRYPSFFTGGTREVELEGEAFFEVAENPDCPFVVKSANSAVYVYGTRFNVFAYPDEEMTHTTLVEGKVTVENADKRVDIRPGEQWCLHKSDGTVEVKKVDVSLYTSWIEGRLKFDDAPLEEIMRMLSRWYGVEVVYQDEALKGLLFGCNFNRHDSIEPLLRIFEANGKIKIEKRDNCLKIKRGR